MYLPYYLLSLLSEFVDNNYVQREKTVLFYG